MACGYRSAWRWVFGTVRRRGRRRRAPSRAVRPGVLHPHRTAVAVRRPGGTAWKSVPASRSCATSAGSSGAAARCWWSVRTRGTSSGRD